MVLRANALAKGYSGARPVTVELLLECLNRGVLPRVPSRGSVGASGDLAPLAHLALPLIGEGEARFDGERLAGGRGARAGRPRAGPAAGEGGARARQRHAVHGRVRRARARPRRRGSRRPPTSPARCRSRRSRGRATSSAGSALRPLPGPGRLGGERAPAARRVGDQRGAPLVRPGAGRLLAPLHAAGARREPRRARYVRHTVSSEVNAATDNPLVFVEDGAARLGGNFHGQPLALALDSRPWRSPSSRTSASAASSSS